MTETTKTVEETQALAKELYEKYPDHKIWLLRGDLGAGKTTLVKGLAKAMGLDQNQVKSPTFIFLADYGPLVHSDLYRLEQEMDPLTLEMLSEYQEQGKRLVIEWPEKAESYFSRHPHLKIHLQYVDENTRIISVEPSPVSED